jgi:hypothetical protein
MLPVANVIRSIRQARLLRQYLDLITDAEHIEQLLGLVVLEGDTTGCPIAGSTASMNADCPTQGRCPARASSGR